MRVPNPCCSFDFCAMRELPPGGLRSSLDGGELLFDRIVCCAGAAAIAFGGSWFVSAGAVCDRRFVDCDALTELMVGRELFKPLCWLSSPSSCRSTRFSLARPSRSCPCSDKDRASSWIRLR